MDAYLTRRGRDAKRHHPHDIVVYPESGVDRRYCARECGRMDRHCRSTRRFPYVSRESDLHSGNARSVIGV